MGQEQIINITCAYVERYIYICILICACTCMFCPLGDSCTGSATYDPKDRGPPTSFQKKRHAPGEKVTRKAQDVVRLIL